MLTGVRIGFERTEYSVREDAGQIQLVVRVLDGVLSDNVRVRLETEDGSATRPGELIFSHFRSIISETTTVVVSAVYIACTWLMINNIQRAGANVSIQHDAHLFDLTKYMQMGVLPSAFNLYLQLTTLQLHGHSPLDQVLHV